MRNQVWQEEYMKNDKERSIEKGRRAPRVAGNIERLVCVQCLTGLWCVLVE